MSRAVTLPMPVLAPVRLEAQSIVWNRRQDYQDLTRDDDDFAFEPSLIIRALHGSTAASHDYFYFYSPTLPGTVLIRFFVVYVWPVSGRDRRPDGSREKKCSRREPSK